MKKIYKLLFTVSLISTIFFTSCYDPIYYEIRQDVAPEEATISGNILAITRYSVGSNEYLVLAANGGLRYKERENDTHGSWKTYDLPANASGFTFHSYDYKTSTHNGYQILKVVADSDYLYLICASYKDYEDEGIVVVDKLHIWAGQITSDSDGTWSGGNWKKIESENISNFYYSSSAIQYSNFTVFQSNAPIKENRCAYVRTGSSKYYQLKDGNITECTSSITASADTNSTSNIYSVAVFNNTPVFFNSKAVTTNETYTSPATRIYYSSDSDLYYSDTDGSNFTKALDCGNTISALATTKDSILIGRGQVNTVTYSTYGGLVKTSLSSEGVPGTSLLDFSSNASFQITTSYLINTVLNATPDKTEAESSLYTTVYFAGTGSSTNVSYSDVGLWSYYLSRGNWNRE